MPLYAQISRGGLRLHLPEHHDDATPGASTVVYTAGLRLLHCELAAGNHQGMRPEIEEQPWGLEMTVTDPFGNRIRFIESAENPPGLGPAP